MTVQKKILDLTGSQYLVQKVKSAINDVDSSLSTHIADTDIHVTTADKTTWNAVTSKANDSDVVHKSGNETVAGFKQFANIRATNSIKGINLDSTTTDLNNCYSEFTLYGEGRGGNIQYYYCNTDSGTANISNLPEAKAFVLTSITTRLLSNSLYVKQILINSNSKTFVRYCNNSTWSSWVNETDSEYVHKSGDETVGGEKTFSDLQIISYGTQYKGARNAYILPEFAAGYSGLSITTMGFAQALKIGNFVLDANNKPSLDQSKAYIQIVTGENNGVNACVLEARNSTSSSLGTSANRWSKIYGTEYYYGSNNVEFSQKFVTTDTAQTITGEKTFSSRPIIYNANATVQADVPNLVFKNPLVERASTTLEGEQTILFTDKNNNNIASIRARTDIAGMSDIILTSYSEVGDQSERTTGIVIRRTPTTSKLHGFSDNITSLGETNRRWSRVYAMSYYYGNNNVEFSDKFVTTDTNQTISGAKTFSDALTIYNSDSSQNTKNLTISSSKIQVGDTSNNDAFGIRLNAGASYVAQILAVKDTSGTQNLQLDVRTKDSSNNLISSMARLRLYTNGYSTFEPNVNTSISLGSPSNKWSKINGVEPSSLSLPSGNASDVIDISSYLVNLDGTDNTYVAPSNGWITINMNNCTGIHATITGFWGDSRIRTSAGALKFLMPVLKNQTVTLTIHGGTINNARFIPCQGNV